MLSSHYKWSFNVPLKNIHIFDSQSHEIQRFGMGELNWRIVSDKDLNRG
jgi:hypothetical protein